VAHPFHQFLEAGALRGRVYGLQDHLSLLERFEARTWTRVGRQVVWEARSSGLARTYVRRTRIGCSDS
jgi:hypothetical protein